MSSEKTTIVEQKEFVERFIEVCESDKPAVIKRLLGISDQAARNYLKGGRLPTPDILLTIAAQTNFSLHWLLTGRGGKFVDAVDKVRETVKPVFTEEQVETIEVICKRVMAETHKETQPKIVLLPPDKLKSEKALDTTTTTTKVVKEEDRKRSK